MNISFTEIMCGTFPEEIQAAVEHSGLAGEECLFCVRSELGPSGRKTPVWLVVTTENLAAFAADPAAEELNRGPFRLSDIEKVRTFQTVGSSSLELLIKGTHINLIRYSNARREMFSRAARQIERLLKGMAFQPEAMTRPSELVCEDCGLHLPGRNAGCPRCLRRRGIFVRTLALMRPYLSFIALLLFTMILGVGLDLLPPLLTRTLVDKVLLPREHANWLPLILFGLVAASAGRCVLNVFIGRTSSTIGTRITRELREQLESKLLSLGVDYYNRHSAGSLMTRVLGDVEYFQSFVVQVAQGFLLNLMLVVAIGAALFVMQWRLAILVMVPIPFVVIGTIFFWRHIYPRYYRLWDSQSKLSQLLAGLLNGIRLVKAFGQEKKEHQRFQQAAGYLQDTRRSVDRSVATFNPIMAFVFGLGGLIIWYSGGNLVLQDKISLGTLMAFLSFVAMFYAPVSALTMFSNWVTGFLSAGQRIFEVLDAGGSLPDSLAPVHVPRIEGTIEFRNVTFGYDPFTPILKNASFRIEPGQFIGVVGKSGSGKTTIINLLCRFYDPQEGEVLVDGVNVRDIPAEILHRQIGLVLQEPFLFRAPIAENIAYGRPEATALEIMDAARAANAHNFIARKPLAYDTKLGELGAGLSGGERQRISIARALLADPRILILDEATSSVDTESEQEIQRALSIVCKGRTTIAVAHRLSTLKNADHILVVDEGQIAEAGTHEELLAKGGLYHRLVKIQTELARVET
jgi:ATP-binding cassette subfamily B protein